MNTMMKKQGMIKNNTGHKVTRVIFDRSEIQFNRLPKAQYLQLSEQHPFFSHQRFLR